MSQSKFIEIPATTSSLSHRKSIHGVGCNDASYITQPTVYGKQIICQYYLRWKTMISRCYNPYELNLHMGYIDCTVCDEWLNSFMVFRAWMLEQDWEGKHLDKDIIKIGNKEYSPESCCFVDYTVNSVVINSRNYGDVSTPFGVCLDAESGKYLAQMRSVRVDVKPHIGYYDTPEKARVAYSIAKSEEIEHFANEETDPRIKAGLMRHAEKYRIGDLN